MAFYRVEKQMMYTVEVYVEADSKREAKELSGEMDGERVWDDHWYDSDAIEISEEEYEENSEQE